MQTILGLKLLIVILAALVLGSAVLLQRKIRVSHEPPQTKIAAQLRHFNKNRFMTTSSSATG